MAAVGSVVVVVVVDDAAAAVAVGVVVVAAVGVVAAVAFCAEAQQTRHNWHNERQTFFQIHWLLETFAGIPGGTHRKRSCCLVGFSSWTWFPCFVQM